jgi:hypothetical protein
MRKKRQVARSVLEGLHGFQYHWPERTEVSHALDEVAKSDEALFVMLRGAAGVGITSVLEEFAAKFHSQAIVVAPRIYSERVNMIGQLLHTIFPCSGFLSYKHVPQSLIECFRGARRLIIIDDLDIISYQNNMSEVAFSQLQSLAQSKGQHAVVMSTRSRNLLRQYSKVTGIKCIAIPVSGVLAAADVNPAFQSFRDWCNRRYKTAVSFSFLSQCASHYADMPIDRVVYACETLYCSELLRIPLVLNRVEDKITKNSLFSQILVLRHRVECEAFS